MSDGSKDPPVSDFRDGASYAYTGGLTREAWAWEFLRRSPAYRAAWDLARESRRSASEIAELAARFGMLALEDPALTALEAKPLWRREASSYVLPLRTAEARELDEAAELEFGALCRRAAVLARTPATHHLLFFEEGRRLQLAIRGGERAGRLCLMAAAPVDTVAARRRLSLLRRFADLIAHGRLSPRLYPADPRSRRLALVLRALDGWMADAPQRAIARAVFAHRDVPREWRLSTQTLRHQTRRMIQRGRWLIEYGYRRLLS